MRPHGWASRGVMEQIQACLVGNGEPPAFPSGWLSCVTTPLSGTELATHKDAFPPPRSSRFSSAACTGDHRQPWHKQMPSPPKSTEAASTYTRAQHDPVRHGYVPCKADTCTAMDTFPQGKERNPLSSVRLGKRTNLHSTSDGALSLSA